MNKKQRGGEKKEIRTKREEKYMDRAVNIHINSQTEIFKRIHESTCLSLLIIHLPAH